MIVLIFVKYTGVILSIYLSTHTQNTSGYLLSRVVPHVLRLNVLCPVACFLVLLSVLSYYFLRNVTYFVRNMYCDSEKNNGRQPEQFIFPQKLKKTANMSEYEAILLTATPQRSAVFIKLSLCLGVRSG